MLAILVLAVAILDPAPSLPAAGGTFAQGRDAARKNLKTKAGRVYEQESGAAITPAMGPAIHVCLAGIKGRDLKPFSVVLRVEKGGVISTALASPETKENLCFAERLKQVQLGEPPAPGYWLILETHFAPR